MTPITRMVAAPLKHTTVDGVHYDRRTARDLRVLCAACKGGRIQMVPVQKAAKKRPSIKRASPNAVSCGERGEHVVATTAPVKRPSIKRVADGDVTDCARAVSDVLATDALPESVDFGFGRLSVEYHKELALPQLCVRLVKKPIDCAGLETLLAAIATFLAQGVAFTILVDARSTTLPSRAILRRAKQWGSEHEPQMDALMQGTAIVLSSTVVRSTVKMILSMSKPKQPLGIFNSLGEARASRATNAPRSACGRRPSAAAPHLATRRPLCAAALAASPPVMTTTITTVARRAWRRPSRLGRPIQPPVGAPLSNRTLPCPLRPQSPPQTYRVCA